MLLRFEDLGGELVRLAQRELRIDDQHLPLAADHRGVHVVADLPAAGVHLERELGWLDGLELDRDAVVVAEPEHVRFVGRRQHGRAKLAQARGQRGPIVGATLIAKWSIFGDSPARTGCRPMRVWRSSENQTRPFASRFPSAAVP